MKLFAVLSWFDEPPAWLAATITSLARAGVHHVIAVDGAYGIFPDHRARSSIDQAEAVMLAADAANIGCTVVRPRSEWGTEVVKRDAMFRMLAGAGAELGTDWVLAIDADEVITDVDARELHAALETTDALAARALIWSHNPPANEQQEELARVFEDAGEPVRAAQRRLYRVLENMRVEHAHYLYLGDHAGQTWKLFDDTPGVHFPFADAVDVLSLRIEHRERQRSARRRRLKHEYYTRRDELELERIPPGSYPALERGPE